MRAAPIILREDPRQAIDDKLSAVFGWFQTAPLPDDMASLIDQLEAAYEVSHLQLQNA